MGRAFLKLDNFSNIFRNNFTRSHPNNDYVYAGQLVPGQLTTELYVNCIDVADTSSNAQGAFALNYEGLDPVYERDATFENVKTKTYIGRLNEDFSRDRRSVRSAANWQNSVGMNKVDSGVKANAPAVVAIGFFEILSMGLQTYSNYAMGSDYVKLYNQFVGDDINSNAFKKAYADIDSALKDGVLDGYNIGQIDQVFNVVLYNENAPKKLSKKHKRLFNNIRLKKQR